MQIDTPTMQILVAEGETAVAFAEGQVAVASARVRLQQAEEAVQAIRAKSSPVVPSAAEWQARVDVTIADCELEIAEKLAEAQLDAARMIVAIRKSALEVLRIASDSTAKPTVAHLRHAVRIYEDYMSDTTATLVESIARNLALNDSKWVKPAAIILDSMSHLRKSHGTGYTSWDSVSDINDVIQDTEPEVVA